MPLPAAVIAAFDNLPSPEQEAHHFRCADTPDIIRSYMHGTRLPRNTASFKQERLERIKQHSAPRYGIHWNQRRAAFVAYLHNDPIAQAPLPHLLHELYDAALTDALRELINLTNEEQHDDY